jgi:hypothetical protein
MVLAVHHLIDRWNYLGVIDDEQVNHKHQTKFASHLDKDAYRILLGFLLNPEKTTYRFCLLSDCQSCHYLNCRWTNIKGEDYFSLVSTKSQCARTIGSNFLTVIFSGWVRLFFMV